MRVTGNLQNVKDKQPVPGSTYRVRCVSVPEAAKKSSTGRMMLEFKLQLCEPLGPEYWDTFTYRVVELDGVGWVNRNMRDLFKCFGAPFADDGFETSDLLNREGHVVIEQQLYKGELNNNIAELCKPA